MDDLEMEISRALEGMQSRALVTNEGGQWRAMPDQVPVLRFYANSIAHFLPEISALAK